MSFAKATWGDIATLEYGKALRGYQGGTGPIPVYGSSGIVGWTDKSLADGPGVVIARKGSLGCHYSKTPFFVIDTAFILRPKDNKNVDMRWAYYATRVLDFSKLATGSAVPSLTRDHFYSVEVHVPPLETQRRIAAILGAYDDLIEVNRRRVAVLEEMARGLFEEWFVRFRFPGHETVPIIDTPDGPLPEGWEWRPFSSLAEEVRETVAPSDVDSDTRYVGLEHLPRRSTTLADYGQADEVGSAKARFRRGDILFGKIRPYFHKVVWTPFEGIASTDAIIWRPKEGRAARALAVASSDSFVAHSVQTSNGTKMPRANSKVLAAYKCAQSNLGLEAKYEAVAMPLIEQAATLQAMNEKLAASRDLLLPRLISGQLSVETAERALEAAA